MQANRFEMCALRAFPGADGPHITPQNSIDAMRVSPAGNHPPLGEAMRVLVILSLILAVAPLNGRAASDGVPAATVTAAGSMMMGDGPTIPPFPKTGRSTELPGKSSERYETRHFMYLVPGESPAIELYLAANRSGDPPDGVFEIGLVRGFVAGLASKAGRQFGEPVFVAHRVGPMPVYRTLVRLSNAGRNLWVHAYVYPRRPSLTFIAIRANNGASESKEEYLKALEIR